ncbi:UNVERIFIED_CONTAM: hypothetical protein FKN15_035141 [Acipenser sinensis]
MTEAAWSKQADSFVVILEVRLITGGPPLRIHIACPIFLMDSPECTRDGRFIFLVRQTDTVPALRLDTVEVKGQGSCGPVVKTGTALVFMFPVTECGTRRTETSEELVYVVEVTAEPEIEAGGFGPVTRDSYLR